MKLDVTGRKEQENTVDKVHEDELQDIMDHMEELEDRIEQELDEGEEKDETCSDLLDVAATVEQHGMSSAVRQLIDEDDELMTWLDIDPSDCDDEMELGKAAAAAIRQKVSEFDDDYTGMTSSVEDAGLELAIGTALGLLVAGFIEEWLVGAERLMEKMDEIEKEKMSKDADQLNTDEFLNKRMMFIGREPAQQRWENVPKLGAYLMKIAEDPTEVDTDELKSQVRNAGYTMKVRKTGGIKLKPKKTFEKMYGTLRKMGWESFEQFRKSFREIRKHLEDARDHGEKLQDMKEKFEKAQEKAKDKGQSGDNEQSSKELKRKKRLVKKAMKRYFQDIRRMAWMTVKATKKLKVKE